VGVVDVDEDGNAVSDRVPIVDGYHQDNWLTWSPDGKWVVYHSHRSPGPVARFGGEGMADDVFLRRTEGSQKDEIRLTDFGMETWNPDWSPDGRKIVFTTWPVGGNRFTLWTIEFDPETGEYGNAEGVLLPDGMGTVDWARWSSTGDLAITEVLGGGKRALRIRSETGEWSERLVEFDGHQATFDWTPDGMNIVYSAMAEDRLQIFTIPRSGGKPIRLSLDDRPLTFPDVSPDGRWIALTRFDHSQELRRMRLK
jgi:Tol biopolymer transport system component